MPGCIRVFCNIFPKLKQSWSERQSVEKRTIEKRNTRYIPFHNNPISVWILMSVSTRISHRLCATFPRLHDRVPTEGVPQPVKQNAKKPIKPERELIQLVYEFVVSIYYLSRFLLLCPYQHDRLNCSS